MKKRRFGIAMIALLVFFMMSISTYAATAPIVSTQSWHLVDSGKHLDWGGSTKYQTQFNKAVKVWNGYKSGVIRKDTIATIQDVKISDYYNKNSDTVGSTVPDKRLRFNKANMDKCSTTRQLNVCIHELGHALGLGHNKSTDVMYFKVTTNTTLSRNDKASYNKCYKNY